MGRTDTSNRMKSPVKYYISFSGETGTFSYWDGAKAVSVDKLEFVVMDTRMSIAGWSDACEARIYSGYFNSTKDKINVRAGNKDLFTDVSFHEDKEKIKAAGGNFQTNVFALADINGEWEIVNIQFSKSSLSAWTEFTGETQMFKVYKSLVTAVKGEQQKKGKVLYYMPTFTTEDLTLELSGDADAAYVNMIKPYLTQNKQEEVAV